MKEQCENCWYYQRKFNQATPTADDPEPVREYSGEGECRRYPPTVVVSSPDTIMIGGPSVLGSEWCGEWKGAENMSASRTRGIG